MDTSNKETNTFRLITTREDNIRTQLACILKNLQKIGEVSNKEDLSLDFSGFLYAPPLLTVGMRALLDGCKEGINIPNTSYLSTMKFPDGIDCLQGECSLEIGTYQDKRYLPLTKFNTGRDGISSGNRQSIIQGLGGLIREQTKVDGNIFTGISYLIDELVNNMVDHSGIPFGWMSAQYYDRSQSLHICFSDSGKGILKSYMDYEGEKDFSYIQSHRQAIIEALKGKSTKDLRERGFGIYTSRNMLVDGLKGDFFLITGNGCYVNDTAFEIKEGNLQGTLAFLRIPISPNPTFKWHDYAE